MSFFYVSPSIGVQLWGHDYFLTHVLELRFSKEHVYNFNISTEGAIGINPEKLKSAIDRLPCEGLVKVILSNEKVTLKEGNISREVLATAIIHDKGSNFRYVPNGAAVLGVEAYADEVEDIIKAFLFAEQLRDFAVIRYYHKSQILQIGTPQDMSEYVQMKLEIVDPRYVDPDPGEDVEITVPLANIVRLKRHILYNRHTYLYVLSPDEDPQGTGRSFSITWEVPLRSWNEPLADAALHVAEVVR